MRVKVIGNRGPDLPEAVIERMPAYRQSRFSIAAGDEYVVYAMALWDGGLIVLVVNENQQTQWHPIELFRVSQPELPVSWQFGYVRKLTDALEPQAFWGYPSLIRDPSITLR
jgi:hypothetical protein